MAAHAWRARSARESGRTLARGGRNSGKGNGADGAAEDVDYGPLTDWIGFNLRMAQDASFQAFSRLSQEIGVRPGRFATLTLIGNNPGITQTALSRANSRDKSTLTPLVADLVRRGLIRRARTRNDRRTYRLTLTKAGETLLQQLNVCARGHVEKLDLILGARDRAQFLRLLRKVASEIG